MATRLGQPSVVGALVAGIVLSPGLLDLVGHLQTVPQLQVTDRADLGAMANLGVVLLMFLAGLETDLDDMKRAGRGALLVATGGVIVPLGLATGAAVLGGLPIREALFVSVMLAATSVSITVQTLLELRQLQSRMGLTILGAAVIDDVMGLVIFSVTLAIFGIGGVPPIWLALGLTAYLVLSLGLGLRFARPVVNLARRVRTGEALLGLSIAFCLLMGWLAQAAGIAAVSGAYLAGLILARSAGVELAGRLRTVAYALPVPVFLVNVGMDADLGRISGGALLLIAVPLASILGKIIGCGAAALLEGLRGRRAAMVGVGMIPRGEVTLVIAALGVQNGVLSQTGYALGVLGVVVTALVTPPLLKALMHRGGEASRDRIAPAQSAA